MPSKSPEQARLMRAVAHGWKPSRIKGPTREVAQEFVDADKRRGKVTGYQFGGMAALGPAYGRARSMMDQYRGVPPQRGMIQRGPTASVGDMAARMRGQMGQYRGAPRGPVGGPRGPVRPDLGGRAGALRQAMMRGRPGGMQGRGRSGGWDHRGQWDPRMPPGAMSARPDTGRSGPFMPRVIPWNRPGPAPERIGGIGKPMPGPSGPYNPGPVQNRFRGALSQLGGPGGGATMGRIAPPPSRRMPVGGRGGFGRRGGRGAFSRV